jgi:hypothetical protein
VATAKDKTVLKDLPLAKITRDPRLQMREGLKQKAVDRYAELMAEGVELPAAVVVTDGKHNWLVNGWHRDKAAAKAGFGTLLCEVRHGTYRDAWKLALGANGDSGLPRDAKTIAKVMEEAFSDKETRGDSDRVIADLCNLSPITVGRWRKKLAPSSAGEKRKGKDGKVRTVPTKPKGGDGASTVTGVTVETAENKVNGHHPPPKTGPEPPAEPAPAAPPTPPGIPSDATHRKILSLCKQAAETLNELQKSPAGVHLEHQQALVFLRNFRELVDFSKPWNPCPECDGSDHGCKLCGGCGFICYGQRSVLSDQHKAKLGVGA